MVALAFLIPLALPVAPRWSRCSSPTPGIARRATVATGWTVSIDRARLGGAGVVLLFGDPDAVREERVPRQRRRTQR